MEKAAESIIIIREIILHLPGIRRSRSSEPLCTSCGHSVALSSRCLHSSHCKRHKALSAKWQYQFIRISEPKIWFVHVFRWLIQTINTLFKQLHRQLSTSCSLPGKDPVVEGISWSGAQVVVVGDHLLHPLDPRVEAQDAGVGHGLHEVGILHCVPGIGQSQTHPWARTEKWILETTQSTGANITKDFVFPWMEVKKKKKTLWTQWTHSALQKIFFQQRGDAVRLCGGKKSTIWGRTSNTQHTSHQTLGQDVNLKHLCAVKPGSSLLLQRDGFRRRRWHSNLLFILFWHKHTAWKQQK